MNLLMRQQPWYQDWFKAQGLNQDKVKLNDSQRNSLTALAAQNGLTLDKRMKLDEAGNVNQKGGFAGMPTWAKVALAAAPAAATAGFGLAGMGPLAAMGGGGAGAGGTGAGLTAASNFASTQIPQAVAGTAATKGATMGGGFLSGLKDYFLGGNGKKGMDPTTLLLGGLSMLGGDEEINSFKGTSADPVRRMTEALDMIKSLSSNIAARGTPRMRAPQSEFEPPAPVEIPGLGFQIGGGLGKDPSLFGTLDFGGPSQFPDLFGGPGGAVPRDTGTNFADLFNNRNKQNG